MENKCQLVDVAFIWCGVQCHITPFLRQLHWLKAKQRIEFKVAVLVYKCLHGSAPHYLAGELCPSADVQGRSRLRSATSSQLVVRQTRRSTLGDRSFLVAGPRLWNTLPQHITSASSLQIFKSRVRPTCSPPRFLNILYSA